MGGKKVVEVRTLKEGNYVIIDGEPCRIVSLTTSQTGKHGSAKARIEAIGLFDGKRRSIVEPVDAKIEVPIIDKRSGQVIAVMGDIAQIMDLETYEQIEVKIPEELKGQLEPGKEVEYWETLGRYLIARVKSE